MTPAFRVKFGLLLVATFVLAAFTWNGASGQFRPRGSPFNPPRGPNPGMNRPGGMGGGPRPGGMSIGWKCPKCGQTGDGAIPPRTCPGCGVTFVNGMGNGSSGGVFGNPGGGPPMNPGFNPPATNPPLVDPNPPVMNPGVPPAGQPPAFNPPQVSNNTNPNPAANSSADEVRASPRKPLVVVLVVGIVVVGASVLVGGALLVIYTVRNNSSRRSSRRYRDDYDA